MISNRVNSLELLRGVACLVVVNSHYFYLFLVYLSHGLRPGSPELLPQFSFEKTVGFFPFTLFYNGDLAVSIFFIISGYVLTNIYL